MYKIARIIVNALCLLIFIAMIFFVGYIIYDGIANDSMGIKQIIVWVLLLLFMIFIVGFGAYNQFYEPKDTDGEDVITDIFVTASTKGLLIRFAFFAVLFGGSQLLFDWTDDSIGNLWKYLIEGILFSSLMMIILYLEHIFSNKKKK